MGMNWKSLNREIDTKGALAFFAAYAGDFAALIALLFFASPLIEMVVCLFNRVERFYPISSYPQLINGILSPIIVTLAVCAIVGQLFQVSQSGASLSGKLRQNPMYGIFALLVIWIIISSIVNHCGLEILVGDWYRNESLPLVLAYFLVYLFCGAFIRGPRKEQLALFTVIASIPLGLYATIRYFLVLNGKAISISAYAVAVFFQHNHYGYYLAMHILLASGLFALGKRRWVRAVALIALVENAAVLSLNNTFGAWLAAFMAFLFQIVALGIVRRRVDRRSLIALGAFLAVTFAMSFVTKNIFSSITQFFFDVKSVLKDPKHSDGAGTTRWMLWKYTAGKIAERPLFGFGNEGITEMMQAATGSSRPHNEVLQYAAFYGIPAAALYVAGVLSVFLRAWKRRAAIDAGTLVCLFGAAAYFASSMFGNTMFYTAPFFFLLLGMGYCGG